METTVETSIVSPKVDTIDLLGKAADIVIDLSVLLFAAFALIQYGKHPCEIYSNAIFMSLGFVTKGSGSTISSKIKGAIKQDE